MERSESKSKVRKTLLVPSRTDERAGKTGETLNVRLGFFNKLRNKRLRMCVLVYVLHVVCSINIKKGVPDFVISTPFITDWHYSWTITATSGKPRIKLSRQRRIQKKLKLKTMERHTGVTSIFFFNN